MKNDILKALANKAKNRLMNKNLRNTYSNISIKIIDLNDEKFYNKVKDMLEKNENITNPIKVLMNESKLSKMNQFQREKYLFDTITKYNKARERYFKEKLKIV